MKIGSKQNYGLFIIYKIIVMNSTNRLKIDISTKENKKIVLELFKRFTKINDIYDFFGVTKTPTNSKIAHEIADIIGFDLNTYKEKPKKYCLQCGKEITSRNGKKFCSSSCAAKYSNTGRKHSDETKYKISKSLSKNGVVVKKEKFCLNCGVELKKRQSKYCSFECQHEYEYKLKVKEWHETPEKFNSEIIPSFIRKFLMKKHNCKCEKCGWGEINETTGNIPLEVHHIDGDCTNNCEENLQLLCPNCHSLTPNHGSLNKLSKRYKLKKYKNLIK